MITVLGVGRLETGRLTAPEGDEMLEMLFASTAILLLIGVSSSTIGWRAELCTFIVGNLPGEDSSSKDSVPTARRWTRYSNTRVGEQ